MEATDTRKTKKLPVRRLTALEIHKMGGNVKGLAPDGTSLGGRARRRQNERAVKAELKAAGPKELFDVIGDCLNHNEENPLNTREMVDIIRRDVFPNIPYGRVLRALKYAASIHLVVELPQKGAASVWVRA